MVIGPTSPSFFSGAAPVLTPGLQGGHVGGGAVPRQRHDVDGRPHHAQVQRIYIYIYIYVFLF